MQMELEAIKKKLLELKKEMAKMEMAEGPEDEQKESDEMQRVEDALGVEKHDALKEAVEGESMGDSLDEDEIKEMLSSKKEKKKPRGMAVITIAAKRGK